MTNRLEDEIQRIDLDMDDQHDSQEQDKPETTEQETQPIDTIHVHYFPDAIVILKEENNTAQVVDSAPITLQKMSLLPAYAMCVFYLFLIFSCIAFQVYCIFNPPIATITIIPKVQTTTLIGTLQFGRVLQPLTISQSLTVPTTGKGHQSAKAATGYITFYNGLFTAQIIPAGTILMGADSVQIITEQNVTIPQASPPSLGYAIVPSRALYPGTPGNIPALDINEACCATAIKAVNATSFTGGQNERNFQTVSTSDIANVATPLKTAVIQSMHGALQAQVQQTEQLFMSPCTPIQTADHSIGAQAAQVKVTISANCSAVAYKQMALEQKAIGFLTSQAETLIGTGYSLFGEVHVTVIQATITHTPLVFLSFKAQGAWIYGLSYKAKEHIKELVAGKTKQQALHLLAILPGIQNATITWDNATLPKDTANIHIAIFAL